MSYTGSSFNDWLAQQAWKQDPTSHYNLDQMDAVLQMGVGRTLGKMEIMRQYAIIRVVFPDRMEQIIEAYVEQFWPRKTGEYKRTLIRDMVVKWKKIKVTSLNLRSPRGVDYSKYVEAMVGVMWTNAQTIAQPMKKLREFIITEMVQIINDLKEETGL